MKTTTEQQGNITIVRPAGRLDFEASAAFQQELERTVAQAPTPGGGVLVDCAALDYVSSAGLRAFIVGARAAKAAGIGLVLCSLTAPVKEVFDVSGFSRIIDVTADFNSAKAKLAS